MKANNGKQIFDEMNERMCATMGEANKVSKLSSLMYSVGENPFLEFHNRAEFINRISAKSSTDKSVIVNECRKIRDKIDDTRYGGLVIDFVNRGIQCKGEEYSFSSCLIKISPVSPDEVVIPYYILADEDTPFTSRVFIGEDFNAYLITQLDNGDIKCVKLYEFHLMSFHSDGMVEYGSFTSWFKFFSKPYFNTLGSSSLDPIKCFFLSEWLNSYKKKIIDSQKKLIDSQKKGSEYNE